ncbi:MAG: MBL fold metallo-hydrolase [Rhodospirillales bacterium]|nr:MBL fold metallo-hydrolase [Rhodospirillales bacterium]MDP6646523.1 MBL fold metallo-hydrolase [Rhodospirillales bacterium]MDP6840164.1 MBL fold metallo-hydrolase [Rhodospirillales bacterium]
MQVGRMAAAGLALFGLFIFTAGGAAAQGKPGKQVRFPCGAGIAQNFQNLSGGFQKAGFRRADVPAGNLQIQFIGHASFLVRSPSGVKVVTDYNDYYRADLVPDIVTMNIQRGNHSADDIEPGITHVLRGWSTDGGVQRHDVTFKDVRVYNLPTNLRNFGGGFTNFSSMFIIQSSGLCVAHMGHLAHLLDKEQFYRIGRIDVLLVPVDGRVTLSYEELVHNIKGINPRVVVPMHFNVFSTLNEFLGEGAGPFPIKRIKGDTIQVSRSSLPQKTEFWLMLPGQHGGGGFGGPGGSQL